jgi:DNA-directed RNA polymerase subunit RPC12/RpoP
MSNSYTPPKADLGVKTSGQYLACPKCQSTDLSKLKRNSFEKNPGYVCTSCKAKLRDASSTKTLYAYVVLGLVWVVLDRVFAHSVYSLAVGLVAVSYGVLKLSRPVAVSR